MNSNKFRITTAVVLLTTLIILVGCRKKTGPTSPPAKTAEQTAQTTATAGEQTICPVMGGKINKDIFVEYQGKKVYFCCADCKEEFQKDSQKYLAKLPQFAK